MCDYTVSTVAHCKMALHCMKYPQFPVNGVMLGVKEKNSVRIVDCVPLMHRSLQLTPMVETALIQIDLIGQKMSPQLQIVGYYQANERLKEFNPDQVAFRIADRIQANFSDALLFMVDNLGFSVDPDRPLYRVYHSQDQKWRPKDRSKVKTEDEERTAATTSVCIQTKVYRDLVDFDNHLDNVTLDFLNVELNDKIAAVL